MRLDDQDRRSKTAEVVGFGKELDVVEWFVSTEGEQDFKY